MAIVTRYFSTTGAGAADGTTWSDRAALFSAGNWSTVITGFAFNGSDSLKCMIEGGLTYTCSQALASGLFANPPTVPNQLFLVGCNSSGAILPIPDPDWQPNQPEWDASTLPLINSTTNIGVFGLANTVQYLIKVTSSGRNGAIVSAGVSIWCLFINSTANASAAVTTVGSYGCVFKCTGSIYSSIASSTSTHNRTRFEGVTGASGSRQGLTLSGSAVIMSNIAVVGVGGEGIILTSATTTQSHRLQRITIANCGATGLKFPSTASQTVMSTVEGCLITGCGGYGIDAQSEANVLAQNNRLRDNASGNFNGFDNYPTDLNNYTTDSADATEYVDATSGDFRVKNSAAIWGKAFGVSEEAPPPSSSSARILGGTVIS